MGIILLGIAAAFSRRGDGGRSVVSSGGSNSDVRSLAETVMRAHNDRGQDMVGIAEKMAELRSATGGRATFEGIAVRMASGASDEEIIERYAPEDRRGRSSRTR